jgi:hypothetical protein
MKKLVIATAAVLRLGITTTHQGYCNDGVIVEAERTDHDKSP